VLDQGVNFYNLKLAKEAEIHKEALTQIVSETFKATEEIVQISKKEQNVSEKSEEALRKLAEVKRSWSKKGEEFETRSRDLSFTRGNGGSEGKIFVRTDLNQNLGSKRES
jgi:hypothetical protein